MFKEHTKDKTKEDDEIFLTQIYNQYYPLMKKIAFNIVANKSDAEDVVQSALINMMKYVDVLKKLNDGQLGAYIAITIKRKAYDFNKMRRRKEYREIEPIKMEEGEELDLFECVATKEPGVEELIVKNELYELMEGALGKLLERDRDILVLKYYHQLTDKEVAEALDMKEQNVRMSVKRAKERLKKVLEKGESL